MTVTSILTAKGRDVVTIEPSADLATACKMLSEHRIGAAVVLGAGGRVTGIISERDIVRALAKFGASALQQSVGQVMTRDVASCGENDEIGSLMQRMTSGKFRHMPVVADDRLVGIVSIGDVVKDRVDAIEQERDAMRDYIRSA
jgi:CBS domain-containing protein